MLRISIFILLLLSFFQGFSQWTQTNGPRGGRILSLCAEGNSIYAGSTGGIWISAVPGASWTRTATGLPNSGIIAVMAAGSNIWVGITGSGIFKSADSCAHWTPANSGLTNFALHALAHGPAKLFAATGGGLFFSSDSGDHWDLAEGSISGKNISSLVCKGSTVITGSYGEGIFRSSDNGNTWQSANSGLNDLFILSLATDSSIIAAGTEGGKVYISTDDGVTWQDSSSGLPAETPVNTLTFIENNLFAGIGGQGIFRRSSIDFSWIAVNNYLTNRIINSIVTSGNRIFAGTDGGGIFRSDDLGETWMPVNDGLVAASVKSMIVKGTVIMTGTSGAGFFISDDNGNNWSGRNNGISNPYISAIASIGDRLFAGTSGAGLFFSDNEGINWLPAATGLSSPYISSLYRSGSDFFAGTSGSGLFISADSGMTWRSSPPGITDSVITSLTVSNLRIFAGTQGSGIFYSADHGNTWSHCNQGLNSMMITALASMESSLFACTPTGLFRLAKSGNIWEQLLNHGTPIRSMTVSFFRNAIFTGTDQNEVLLSTDNGDTWEAINTGLPESNVRSLVATGMNLFAGTGENGVWKRPLSGLFVNRIIPDTAVLKQFQGCADTLFVESNIDWSVEGNIPDWFSLNKQNGSGNDTIVIQSLKPNLAYLARNTTLLLFSSIAPAIPFAVLQLGRSAGVKDHTTPMEIMISSGPSPGMINLSASSEIKSLTLYSIHGLLIRQVDCNGRNVSVNLSSMEKGLYILKISGIGWTLTRKYEL